MDGLKSKWSKEFTKAYNKEYREKNKDRLREQTLVWREKNRDELLLKKKQYYEGNKVSLLKKQKEYAETNKDTIKIRRRAYRKPNWNSILAKKREYVKKNPAKMNVKLAARRAKKLQRTPPWLSKEDIKQIIAIYKESNRLTRQSSIKHHVDHIIPLVGENVSGLHVPTNLQILTATENYKKSNKYDPNSPE